jgi:hypothetical protein
MSTEAQINANQQNAQKSTGPRSAEGKAAVSQNAVKHGLFGSEAVIKGENEADFDLFSKEMLSELAPVGFMESMLAGRVVNLWWRLKRLERMQNQAIDVMIERDGPSPLTMQLRASLPKFLRDVQGDQRGSAPELILGRAAIKDCANYKVLGRLSIYERRIENSMFKTMRELERLQMLRKLEEEAAEEQSAPAIPSTALRTGPKACGFEAATQKAEKKVNLKKQSQFAPAQINPVPDCGKTKPNKANRRPLAGNPTAENPGAPGEFDYDYAKMRILTILLNTYFALGEFKARDGLAMNKAGVTKNYGLFLVDSKILTVFLPACFAVYSAWSDRLVISSGVLSASYRPRPTLIDNSICSLFQVVGELATASTIRWATTVASLSEVLSKMTANSSPPYRAAMSICRMHSLILLLISRMTLSPARWPKASFIFLRLSTSTIISEICPPYRRDRQSSFSRIS